jgi:hypothetical protein
MQIYMQGWITVFQVLLSELKYAAVNYNAKYLNDRRLYVDMGNVDSTSTEHAGLHWMNIRLYDRDKTAIVQVITDHEGHYVSFTGVSDHLGGGCYDPETMERKWTMGELPEVARRIAKFLETAVIEHPIVRKSFYTELDIFGSKAIIKDGMPDGV